MAVQLDLGRLLGFKHVAGAARSGAHLARALGATSNKVGEGPALPTNLARALGATYNKVGEGPAFPTDLVSALGATHNKIGENPG